VPAGSAGWRLEVAGRGAAGNLRLAESASGLRPLEPGQVRVGLRAAGVSSLDVQNVLGTHPGDAGPLGLEGAGVVLETGPAVSGLVAGDKVMGFFSGAFGPAVVTDQRLLARVPAGWSLAEAAGMPLAFLAQEFPEVRYQAPDLNDGEADRLGELLERLTSQAAAGVVLPPRVATWDVRRAPEAFGLLSREQNAGTVVLTIPAELDPDGTVLVTVGTAPLGGLVARRLAERGVRHLVVVSPLGAAAPAVADLAAGLRELGASVRVVACDAADPAALAGVIASVPAEHPLTGVVYAAGAGADGLIGPVTPERVDAELRATAAAAWNLHQLTAGLDLRMFVLFSSLAGVLGSEGQGNHAAACTFLDALAVARRGQGLAGLSLAWGPWERAPGIAGALADEDGLVLFDAADGAGAAALVPVLLDIAGLGAGGEGVPPLLRGLARPGRRLAAQAPAAALAARLAGRSAAEAEAILLDTLRADIAAVMGDVEPDDIDLDQSFRDFGLDSFELLDLRNRLGAVTGLRLPATLIFDYPTPPLLTRYLLTELMPELAPPSIEDELDRFDALLSADVMDADAMDEAGHARVAARLSALTSKWATLQAQL